MSRGNASIPRSFPVTKGAIIGDVEQFVELLELHLVRLGINQAKQVLLLADGAEWIRLAHTSFSETRKVSPPDSIVELLDFFHAWPFTCRVLQNLLLPNQRQYKHGSSKPEPT